MKYITAIFSLLFLHSCQNPKPSTYKEGLENCNRILEEKMKANPNGSPMVDATCLIGYQIPAFEGVTLEGKKINSEGLKGKLSVINFWFTSCRPCVAEIPGFNLIAEKYGMDKINFLAIGRDDREEVQSFLQDHPWKFDHIADGKEIIEGVFKAKWGFPTTFLLNKNAEIILAFSGGKTDSTAVQEIQNKLIPTIETELK